ncbi:MAG: transcription termination/antitermination protein NusA, partial [Muribaculaceae bacterium]|nr:transcription termination/antitermination protein NusA [Muribaculaceae bacterium]
SLAIGKGGLNIKLASILTGYSIDVYRDVESEGEEDIYLDEFKDEIDEWVIETLKNVGLATAKSVLRTPREDLINRPDLDLEESTVDHLLAVLSAEFDD